MWLMFWWDNKVILNLESSFLFAPTAHPLSLNNFFLFFSMPQEDEFDGEFTIKSVFEGKVVVTYETKKQREHVMTVVRDVKRIMTKENGFKFDDEGRPYFITRGKCKCRFGIEQNVLLKQTAIAEP